MPNGLIGFLPQFRFVSYDVGKQDGWDFLQVRHLDSPLRSGKSRAGEAAISIPTALCQTITHHCAKLINEQSLASTILLITQIYLAGAYPYRASVVRQFPNLAALSGIAQYLLPLPICCHAVSSRMRRSTVGLEVTIFAMPADY